MECCYCFDSILDTTRLNPVVLTHFIIQIAILLAFFVTVVAATTLSDLCATANPSLDIRSRNRQALLSLSTCLDELPMAVGCLVITIIKQAKTKVCRRLITPNGLNNV